jgi:hypothetical protein
MPMRAASITADDAADLIVQQHATTTPCLQATPPCRRLRTAVGADRGGAWHDKARRQVAAFAGELEGNFFPP